MNTIKLPMRKITFVAYSVLSFISPIVVLAQASIKVPGPEKGGYKTIGEFVSNALTLAFALGILVALIMLIWGAFEWITSGGDKENVGKARNRIINALIGLAVLAIAFALARVAAVFLGFDLGNIAVPSPKTGFPGPQEL